MSISQIVKAGCTVQFEDRLCKIKKNGSIISKMPASTNRLFKVEHLLIAAKSPEHVDILMLHCRLGHISVDTICQLIHSNAVLGLHLIDNFPPFTSNLCKYAKTT